MTKFTSTDFKSICDDFLATAKVEKSKVSDLYEELRSKLPQVSDAAYRRRFRSIYRTSISEAVDAAKKLSREEVVTEVLKADNVQELWASIELSHGENRNFFDKYFGVSTFQRAKAVCELEKPITKYEPSIDENLSLVCSQVLGDGCYDKVRGSILLSHGEKQFQYAFVKAGFFNKAFPSTKPAGNTKLMTHTQGHKYSYWYSGRLPSKICAFIETSTWVEKMDQLTPFGIMLYILDDGYVNLDFTVKGNNYVQVHIPFGEVEAKHFQSILMGYGIHSTLSNKYVKIGSTEDAVKFYKNFLEPFKDDIPECMHYKFNVKI